MTASPGGADPVALTGVQLDRAGDGRRADRGWVENVRGDTAGRVVLCDDTGIAVDREGLDLGRFDSLSEAERDAAILLGISESGPVWALDQSPPAAGRRARLVGGGGRRGSEPSQFEGRLGLRELAAALAGSEAALAAYACAMVNWARSCRYCSQCGTPTLATEAGALRNCPSCGTHHHPRTDPVAIMLVTRGEELLLGRQGGWPAGRYSALAGFVSPGESLEEAVAREVFEEAGVTLSGEPRYVASQPWPFPGSLMIGFIARWASGEPPGADPEIEDVSWFGRDAVEAATRRDDTWTAGTEDGLLLPPRTAIARRLVERWLAETA